MKMNAFIVIVLASILGLSHQEEWSYDYETQWPGICRTGKLQSPINIMTRDTVLDKHGAHIRGPLEFRGYSQVNVTAVNTGHTLKWARVEDTPAPILSGGPLRANYSFLQFHLHWLSEHAIDGMKYPLEIHMVHVQTGLTLDEALERPDGLAIIGVLAQIYSGDESERALREIMTHIPGLLDVTSEESAADIIDITQLLSPDPQAYYTYHGSLTTPSCEEVATWIVMSEPLIISDTQYKVFSKVDVGGTDNYRSLQPANRVVYRSSASCLVPGALGGLIGLLHCFASSIMTGVSKGLCSLMNVKRKLFGKNLKECSRLVN